VNGLGRPAREGDSPVTENLLTPGGHLSTAEHVKFRGNLGRPRSKAKYSW
jgi:hypothetical protein